MRRVVQATTTAVALGCAAAGCGASATARMIDETFDAPAVRARVAPERQRAGRAQPDDDAALAAGVTREMVLARVAARDPALAAQAHQVRAMLHAARAEGALPAPELNFQVWNLPLARPYSLGEADMYMVELRQMFPAAGSLGARVRAGVEEARAALAALSVRERESVRRAAEAYADYLGAALHHRAHAAQLARLGQMREAAAARIAAAAGATLADVQRVELELARERRGLVRFDGAMTRARAELNALMLRAPDAPLGPPRETEAETVAVPLETLLATAAGARGATREARARVRAARARTEAARAEASWPAFTVGLSYWQMPGERPGIGTMAAMTLPWLWGGPRARVEEAREREAAEALMVRDADVTLQREVAAAHARLEALARELATLRNEVRPATLRLTEATASAYVTGGVTLLAWIDAARGELDVQEEEADLAADMSRAVAALETAVGAALPRTAVRDAPPPPPPTPDNPAPAAPSAPVTTPARGEVR